MLLPHLGASLFTQRHLTGMLLLMIAGQYMQVVSSWSLLLPTTTTTTTTTKLTTKTTMMMTMQNQQDGDVRIQQPLHTISSRRSFVKSSTETATAAVIAVWATSLVENPECADAASLDAVDNDEATLDRKNYRDELLQLIADSSSSTNKKESEKKILDVIQELVPLDPAGGRAATPALANDLDGPWQLIWSAKAEAFSPLLKLPPPFRPTSYQYVGKAASSEVGPNRIAQGLTGGILNNSQLWLSSGVTTVSTSSSTNDKNDDDAVLEILPPFRLEWGGQYGSNKPKQLLVEAGSDADFRKLNARTTEAQAAPKNRYRQMYLERQGKGSLRISTITEGDPVIVGAIFVHQKL